MFNKRGAGSIPEHLALWIPKFIYLVIAFLSVIFLIFQLVITKIDIAEAEARILINRIIYSPNIISYFDSEIGRYYPGIIDFEKYKALEGIDTTNMDKRILTYGKENRLIAAKLTLKNLETKDEGSVFYNKDNYNFWEPRVLSNVIGGSGSVKSVTEQRYVLIKDNNKIYRGILIIHVIVRR